MIDVLDKEFAHLISLLLYECENHHVLMVPYEKLRSPQRQAELWVNGRSVNEIQHQIRYLHNAKAYFLASCLERARIKEGKIITNALPGYSWHQWGEAVDCYWLKEGKVSWDLDTKDENDQNGYAIYARIARKLGLESGYYWKDIVDATHIQLQPYSSPGKIYSLPEINEVMEDYFG